MGKRGPVPRRPEQQRRHRVGVYFSEEELRELDRRLGLDEVAAGALCGGGVGQQERKRLAEYLRRRALGQHVPPHVPKINLDAYGELARTAVNIKDIAARLKLGEIDISVVSQLESILKDIEAFRDVLLGLRESKMGDAAVRQGPQLSSDLGGIMNEFLQS